MDRTPFAISNELNRKLYISPDDPHLIQRRSTPTTTTGQIQTTTSAKTGRKARLPGQRRIALQDFDDITSYLNSELVTTDLNKIAPYLWLVAEQDSSQISSLTHQIILGREIIVTEDPQLHLLWIGDRIYIKPVPKYLLSHAFWEFYLTGGDPAIPEPIRKDVIIAALGFLRSYLYLIQNNSDFAIATNDEYLLLPKHVSYSEFVNFISAFEKVKDTIVSPRYQFGELPQAQINFWSKPFLSRRIYQNVHQHQDYYFSRIFGPISSVVKVLAIAISAMFVVIPITRLSHEWFLLTLFALLCLFVFELFVAFVLIVISLGEGIFAYQNRKRKLISHIDSGGVGVSTKI
jgi:hypothetical protein